MILYNIVKRSIRWVLTTFCGAQEEGFENLPSSGGCIVCVNHKGFPDTWIVGTALPGFVRFIAKAELFAFKPFGWLMRKLGSIPVKRGKPDVGAMRAAEEIVRDGGLLVIFPQGKRYPVFRIEDGKPGAARIAYRAGVPVIPAAKVKFRVVLGEPLVIGPDAKAETKRIMEAIRGLLEREEGQEKKKKEKRGKKKVKRLPAGSEVKAT